MSGHQDPTVAPAVLHHGHTAHLTQPAVPGTGPANISIAGSAGVVTPGVEGGEVLGCQRHHQVVARQVWPGGEIVATHRVQSQGGVQDGAVVAGGEVGQGGGAGGHHHPHQHQLYPGLAEAGEPGVDRVEVGDDVVLGVGQAVAQPLVQTEVHHDENLRVDLAHPVLLLPALPPQTDIEAVVPGPGVEVQPGEVVPVGREAVRTAGSLGPVSEGLDDCEACQESGHRVEASPLTPSDHHRALPPGVPVDHGPGSLLRGQPAPASPPGIVQGQQQLG